MAPFPALAQVRAVPTQPADEREALRGVEVFLVNEGDVAVSDDGPRQLEVTAADGTRMVLERVPGPRKVLAPGGFVKLRYVPVGLAKVTVPPDAVHPAADIPERETVLAPSSTGSSAGFFSRFEPHEPIYGAVGAGDAATKLQFSFGFRPFGGDGALSHLRFAYTQTMFWATDKPSAPFRASIYSPEVYADVPVKDGLTLQFGYRHDSNGGGIIDSVDANRLFGRVVQTFDLGGDWHFDLAPQGWVYFGEVGNAPDLKDYWGNAGLTAAIRQDDGLKVAVSARGNFGTGRGGAELFVSYPLAKLDKGIGIYLFGQGFTGYGEALDDYRRNATHARLGIALTR
ncbi:MAG: phospholipase A [Pseudomonadota bacterium]